MEALAADGHRCHVIAGSPRAEDGGVDSLRNQLKEKDLTSSFDNGHHIAFEMADVSVEVVADSFHFFGAIKQRVTEFAPDIALVSEDPSMLMLQTVLEAGAKRAVYLAHSQATLPFGPAAFERSAQRRDILNRAHGIITVSKYVAGYITEYGNMQSEVIYSPVYGDGPWPHFDGSDGAIVMVNPSRIKGLDVLLGLATAMPELPFAAIPTWASTAKDRADLEAAGVAIIQANDDIDVVLAQMKVLLVPSLWGEAFGQIVVEAMLRGIPVLASDLGGLPEAKLGVEYLLPVQPIQAYEDNFDECNVRVPIIPEQNIKPWAETLQRVMTDHALYTDLSQRSRQAAMDFVRTLGFSHYIRFFESVLQEEKSREEKGQADFLRSLSPQKRALLLRRLKEKQLAKLPTS